MYRKDFNRYWQSMEEICESPEALELIHREFPVDASVLIDDLTRRDFLKIMGASLALAGLSGCSKPPSEKIIPAITAPEGFVPGKSVYYARSLNRGGYAVGVLVESYMGRPIKIDGNPTHPMSLGASDVQLQAEILNLYDPDRLQRPLKNQKPSSWKDFKKDWFLQMIQHQQDKGEGLRILYERNTSDTFKKLKEKFLKKFPKAEFIGYDPINRDLLREATLLSFGQSLEPIYDFSQAQVILALSRDFLSDEAIGLRYARDFSDRRRVNSRTKEMSRLYVVESDYSLTGAMADHRLNRNRKKTEELILALARMLDVSIPSTISDNISNQEKKWLKELVKDLKNNKGKSLIIASENLAPHWQSLVFLLNEKLGNIGKSMSFTKPADDSTGQEQQGLISLAEQMHKNKVKSLIILSLNPNYATPADLKFQEGLKKVPFSISLTSLNHETSRECRWALPESHPLESWSDSRSLDGTLSLNQPLIAPLYDSKNSYELLSLLLSEDLSSHELIKENYTSLWENSLAQGLVKNSAYEKRILKTIPSFLPFFINSLKKPRARSEIELHFLPDPNLREGRNANNGWLQELPKPISKTCWGNAAFISPYLAQKNKLQNGYEIEIASTVGELTIPVWIQPGLAEDVLIIHYGYGQSHAGKLGSKVGHNAFKLLSSKNQQGVDSPLSFKSTGNVKELACTQLHYKIDTNEPIKVIHKAQLTSLKKEVLEEKSLFPEPPLPQSEQYAWGMSIDLNVCIGCNACVIGCQSENNIPIVGEEEVKRGREMHWLRIDRYYEGTADFSQVHFQPLACVHCEKAPCEVVCPVAATTHSNEGLNEMVYNRCVGTRYCSNNCPYKVRRFNFLEYHDRSSAHLRMRSNPEVSVRSRGVMEKCTYCTQRISEAKIMAKLEDRDVREGDIKTACQMACPTQAIVFGNLKDPNSQVSLHHEEASSYQLLGELGTKPRTQYLMKIKNPNPELE